MTQLYSLRSTTSPGEYIVTKFDGDLEVQAVYSVSKSACSGPDGHRPKCKHREMLKLFLSAEHIDDGWFLDWDTRLWRGPLIAQDIGELADQLSLDNSRESPTPTLGVSKEEIPSGFVKACAMDAFKGCLDDRIAEEEEALAERLAPSFASEASPAAIQSHSAASAPGGSTAVEPSSATPAVVAPAPAGSASPVAGANSFKKRKIT